MRLKFEVIVHSMNHAGVIELTRSSSEVQISSNPIALEAAKRDTKTLNAFVSKECLRCKLIRFLQIVALISASRANAYAITKLVLMIKECDDVTCDVTIIDSLSLENISFDTLSVKYSSIADDMRLLGIKDLTNNSIAELQPDVNAQIDELTLASLNSGVKRVFPELGKPDKVTARANTFASLFKNLFR